jgi:hypothetical protein
MWTRLFASAARGDAAFTNQPTHIWLMDSMSVQQANVSLATDIWAAPVEHARSVYGGRGNDLSTPGITLAVSSPGKDPASRNATGKPDMGRAMLTIDRTEMAADGADIKPASTALVSTAPASDHAPPSSRMARPDPIFVTHLIATAQQVPQTRHLRRAAPQEALSAYATQLQPAQRIGRQTRQII